MHTLTLLLNWNAEAILFYSCEMELHTKKRYAEYQTGQNIYIFNVKSGCNCKTVKACLKERQSCLKRNLNNLLKGGEKPTVCFSSITVGSV